jgi:FG-GAP-like repeat
MYYQPLTACTFFSKQIRVRAFFIVFTFFILTLTAQYQVSAATFTVTNTADSGAGSLRQAVADANATTAADTINFAIPASDPNCDTNGVCTITLTSGVIIVQAAGGNLTIANQTGASKLLISGNNITRIFEGVQDANLTLDGLTITRGVATSQGQINAGVVSNFRGTLTIMNSVFTQNSGELIIATRAFDNKGVMNMMNTTVNNNAGKGIYVSNELGSGGIANIVNSTISNNTSTSGNGGGIYFLGRRLSITNSTISGNTGPVGAGLYAGKGGDSQAVPAVLTNCTVTNNNATTTNDGPGGGGIEVFQITLNLRNTIVAGNTSVGGVSSDVKFNNAVGTSLGNNLIGTSINAGFGAAQWQSSDLLNQIARLAPLANNGGAAQTHALLPDSPAINAGNNCVLTANGCGDNNPAVPTDQRGASRVGNVDIGAYEFTSRSSFDFDSDGKSDFAVFRPSSSNWYQLSSSNNSFSGVAFGQTGDLIVPADYDGDGKTDVSVFRPASGNWYRLNSSNNQFVAVQFGQNGDIPVPGDFDGDSKADISVFRPSNGAWYRTNSSNNQFVATQFGQNGDKPQVADFDGDGKTDVAVWRPATGSWYSLQSSNNSFSTTNFGQNGDVPTAADYDGDGKADISVFRSSSGTWYRLNSNDSQFVSVQFGSSGDIPAVGDFDGDGKADISVFRPSSGIWYQQRSTSGFTAQSFGTNGDIPIQSVFGQ